MRILYEYDRMNPRNKVNVGQCVPPVGTLSAGSALSGRLISRTNAQPVELLVRCWG